MFQLFPPFPTRGWKDMRTLDLTSPLGMPRQGPVWEKLGGILVRVLRLILIPTVSVRCYSDLVATGCSQCVNRISKTMFRAFVVMLPIYLRCNVLIPSAQHLLVQAGYG